MACDPASISSAGFGVPDLAMVLNSEKRSRSGFCAEQSCETAGMPGMAKEFSKGTACKDFPW